jgi:hypothetical protein
LVERVDTVYLTDTVTIETEIIKNIYIDVEGDTLIVTDTIIIKVIEYRTVYQTDTVEVIKRDTITIIKTDTVYLEKEKILFKCKRENLIEQADKYLIDNRWMAFAKDKDDIS